MATIPAYAGAMFAPALNRIDRHLEPAAAALFGGAVGYAAFLVLRGEVESALAYACATGMVAAFLCARAVGAAPTRRQHFRVATFAPRELEFLELEELLLTDAERLGFAGPADNELLLTDADRLEPSPGQGPGPLLLDDVVGAIGPGSRVVQLFHRTPIPTPGESKSRMDGHPDRAAPTQSDLDASEALSNALAELRRSLR